jgi:hypothetical protein
VRPVTPALIERTAARMAAGGWRYTTRQLYYAVCAEAETRPSRAAATGELGLGLILVLVALILIRFPIPFTALLALGLLLVVTGATQRLMRRAPPGMRVFALSYPDFVERAGDVALPGLLGDDGAPQVRSSSEGMHLVVCDTRESARVVSANATVAGMDDAIIAMPFDMPLDATPSRRVVALHDASPRGCALPLELVDRGLAVVDAGLRPGWLEGPDHQVIEGAPARLPRDLASLLTEEEIAWLAGGQRVELATLTPEQVMRLVAAAVDAVDEKNRGVFALNLHPVETAKLIAPHPRGGMGSAPARDFAAPGRGAFPSVQ